MTKSTAAVIMVSVAKLPPWGDVGWRFSGAMQLVHDGPDWLYAQWPVLDGAEHHRPDRFATLVLREDVGQRAADIAVMASRCSRFRSGSSSRLHAVDADDHQHLGAIRRGGAVVARVRRHVHVRGHSVETELVALDVVNHEARLVVAIGRQ